MALTIEQLSDLHTELSLKITAQEKTIGELKTEVGKLNLKLATAAGTSLRTKSKEEKPEIPAELVIVNGKEYKWKVATFRLIGNHEVFKSAEAALDESILAKIIAIKGQSILEEQV